MIFNDKCYEETTYTLDDVINWVTSYDSPSYQLLKFKYVVLWAELSFETLEQFLVHDR